MNRLTKPLALLADPDRADAALDEASQPARDYGLQDCGAEN